MSKFCKDCVSSYTLPDQPTIRRCRKSQAEEGSDPTLCQMMRAGTCGRDGTMWRGK